MMDRLQNAEMRVIQLGGLSESSFSRKYPDRVYRHGQNRNYSNSSHAHAFDMTVLSADAPVAIQDWAETDNHHSPMKPSQYISARLVPMLDYYRTQLPRKYMEWKATVFLILLVRHAFFIQFCSQTEQN